MDQDIKQKYQKYKYIVKKWEKTFKEKQGRIPSKYDIREAPKEIRDSYKMYYKLKTSFLENTLGDVLLEDGFDVLENSQGEFSFGSLENDTLFSQKDSQISLSLSSLIVGNDDKNSTVENVDTKSDMKVNQKTDNLKEFEPVAILDVNKHAWQEDSKKDKRPSKVSTEKNENKSTLKPTLNTKLFSSTSFSKRNPRKSLSQTTSKSLSKTKSQEFSSSSQELLPDLEAILLAKSQEKAKETNSLNTFESNTKTISKTVDQKWLNRCISEDNDSIVSALNNNHSNETKNEKINLGISNIHLENISQLHKSSVIKETENIQINELNNDSDCVVSNSEDESTSRICQIRHIRKRRRLQEENTKQISDVKETEKTPNQIQIQNIISDEKQKLSEEIKTKQRKKENEKKRQNTDMKMRKSQRNRKDVSYTETSVSPSVNDVSLDELHCNDSNDNSIDKKSTRSSKIQNQEKIKTKSKRSRKNSNKNKIPDIVESSESVDLKYNWELKNETLASVPRVNIEEIINAEKIVQEYVENNRPSKLPLTVTNNKNTAILEAKKKKLEMKIAAGKLNENFVRIDVNKKIYVRGKRNMNFSRYKKKMWKQKKAAALSGPDMDMGGCDGGIITCFNCGNPGHVAKNCSVKGDKLLPLDVEMEDEDDSLFPTLEEAEEMAANKVKLVHSRNIESMPEVKNEMIYKNDKNNETANKCNEIVEMENEKKYIGHQIPKDFLEKCGLLNENGVNNQVEPLYSVNSDGSVQSATTEVYETLHMFGHKNFRKGQDKAIMRILSGLSTLVTLSTGSGKSLCYQLPAYLYSRKKKCLTLVVSPLVSLMEDQVHGVPHFLRAHCLHTNQTASQKEKVLEMINRGEVDILLVSPEAIVSGEKSSSGFGSIIRKLPPIAFACIDEAHCVSQWSHNFRPSYLMICKVLREKLKIRTILGLTATATLTTKESIIRHLSIPDGENGVVSDIPLPDNLILSVSKDSNRDTALVQLLRSERFASCQSIIIYCTRRDECERIAGFIRSCFQDRAPETNKRKRVNWYAEAYHAGMPASRRRTIQNAFMRNELRVIVATIAFGMGINKSDIRAIIHFNMPKAFESYVQEVGRAGRDGKIAHCHLFLDSKGLDRNELKRHIYANSFDRYVIRKLLQRIFVQCSCNRNLETSDFSQSQNEESESKLSQNEILTNIQISVDSNAAKHKRKCPGHEIGFSVEKTVEALDIPEENISTILYYLELDGRWNVNVLSHAYIMCKVISYGGPKYLKQAAKECPPLAMAVAIQIKNKTFDHDANIIEFPVIEIASAIGWNSGVVKYQLKNLEWTTADGLPKRSCISVSFYDLGFRVKAPGDLTDDELDEALDALYSRSVQQEKAELIQLQCVYNGLESLAYDSFVSCSDSDFPTDRSNKLKKIIRNYFQNDLPKDIEITKTIDNVSDDEIINDVLCMINMYPENQFTGRTLARIFHGIQSPNYPALMWSKCKYWRAHCKTDFNRIVKLANSVIVKMRV